MRIGVPLERGSFENRVGLTPAGVETLVQRGHQVYIETNAGLESGFLNEDYQKAGADLVYTAAEVWGRAEIVVRVGPILPQECDLIVPGQTIMGFQHFAVASRKVIDTLMGKEVTAIAYETIQRPDGSLPILIPMSMISGRIAAQVGARYLERPSGGKGILLSGVPGVPGAEVGILGGGVVGTNAARSFLGLGAHVSVLDVNIDKLEKIDELFGGAVTTMVSNEANIRKVVSFVDVLVGAVLIPGAPTPRLVSRDMVRGMRPKSVVLDIAIDQGGCVETSHPTTHGDPVYVEEGIIHYCVPNIPAKVPRTSTYALTNSTLPLIQKIAGLGLREAVRTDLALARGINFFQGYLVRQEIGAPRGIEARDLDSLLRG